MNACAQASTQTDAMRVPSSRRRQMKNKSVLCRPFTTDQETSCKLPESSAESAGNYRAAAGRVRRHSGLEKSDSKVEVRSLEVASTVRRLWHLIPLLSSFLQRCGKKTSDNSCLFFLTDLTAPSWVNSRLLYFISQSKISQAN